VPTDIPQTVPESEPTVATDGLPLDHEPPGGNPVALTHASTHTPEGIVNVGDVLTFTVVDAAQAVAPDMV